MSRTFACPVALLTGVACQTVHSQPVVGYRAPSDTVYYELVNPYRMYWVRGIDTVGNPLYELTVESQLWRAGHDGLRVEVRQMHLDTRRQVKTDTLDVSTSGRVLGINGKPAGMGMTGRVDFLLHLPPRPLTLGMRWADTLTASSRGVGGPRLYEIHRVYHVTRVLDTLGSQVAEVAAQGTVRYRDGWWADSTAGTSVWLDVSGPVRERYWFDVGKGQLLGRHWEMELVGRGGIPGSAGGTDTIPAGLRSAEDDRMIMADRARVLTRPLPGRDTSITIAAQGIILLHTVARTAEAVEAGMARNDGMVGTTRARFSGGRPVSYESVWSDSTMTSRTRQVSRRGDSLLVHADRGDTALAIPAGVWGVADYGMEEFLVPLLLALPRDGAEHPITIFRPYAGRWDMGTAVVREAPVGYVAAVRWGGQDDREVMLITRDGDYLFGEKGGAQKAQRVPPPGSARRAQLDAMLKQLGVSGK